MEYWTTIAIQLLVIFLALVSIGAYKFYVRTMIHENSNGLTYLFVSALSFAGIMLVAGIVIGKTL